MTKIRESIDGAYERRGKLFIRVTARLLWLPGPLGLSRRRSGGAHDEGRRPQTRDHHARREQDRRPPDAKLRARLDVGLKIWAETQCKGAEPDDLFFPRPDGSRIPIDGSAEFYREHFVRDAGVDRPELFVRSRSRLALRVHDLRGFFVTYPRPSAQPRRG